MIGLPELTAVGELEELDAVFGTCGVSELSSDNFLNFGFLPGFSLFLVLAAVAVVA